MRLFTTSIQLARCIDKSDLPFGTHSHHESYKSYFIKLFNYTKDAAQLLRFKLKASNKTKADRAQDIYVAYLLLFRQ